MATRDDDLQRRVEHAVRPPGQHPLGGHEDVVDVDVVAPGAAHPQRVPVVEHGDALGVDRHGHVQHDRRAVLVEHEHRREHVADRDLAGEDLVPADAVAAVDGHGRAAGVGEVGAARRDEHDAVVGDPLAACPRRRAARGGTATP